MQQLPKMMLAISYAHESPAGIATLAPVAELNATKVTRGVMSGPWVI